MNTPRPKQLKKLPMSPTLHFKEVSATNSFYNYLNIKPIQKRGVAGSAAGWIVGNTVSSNGSSCCKPADTCSSQQTNRHTPRSPAHRFVYLSSCLLVLPHFPPRNGRFWWTNLTKTPVSPRNGAFSWIRPSQTRRVSCWTKWSIFTIKILRWRSEWQSA